LATREQRFVFDEVAELYARVRPGYPDELIDRVIEFAGQGDQAGRAARALRMLEIGCGGGQATKSFAARGLSIVALEPGRNLARCAREQLAAVCPENPRFEIAVSTFEDFALPPKPFDLVISAQAFHWLRPELRLRKSAQALKPGGVLAVFGNKPRHTSDAVYSEIDAAYAECAPSMRQSPLEHDACVAGDYPIAREFAQARQFAEICQHAYPWSLHYGADQYVALMQTQSNHRMLPPGELDALLARIHGAIKAAGDRIQIPYVAHLVIGRRL
jgi:SAM-dependent methyltransferase